MVPTLVDATPYVAEPPTWIDGVAWEPLIRLAARSLGARAAWVRVGDDTRIVGIGVTLHGYTEAWLRSISRRAVHAEYLAESSGGVHAFGVALGHDPGDERGSLGVTMTRTPGGRSDTEIREILSDVAQVLQRELTLWREADRGSESVRTLNILGRAVANMQLGVTITDRNGKIVFTNPAEARMHGYVPDELIGLPANTLAPPTLWRAIHMQEDGLVTSWTRESVNRHRDGREFPVLLWSDVIEDGDGKFRGLVTCSQDLSPQREVEEALRRSESMFRAIFDNAPVGLALVGHDTWIVRANPRLGAILGIEGDLPDDARLIDFVHPDDEAGTREFYARALRDTTEVSRHEHRIGREGGDFSWIHTTISPVLDSRGRGPLWIALVEDTTRRRALEEQLRHSQKMEAVGRLAGGVAHDFNNLLTAIRGIAEMLLLESDESHPMAEDIREIHRAADTAADLTRQLLAFSRRQVTQNHLQDLNTIAVESEKMLARLVGDEIALAFDLESELSPTIGDKSQMEQVFLNLVLNARDATQPGGRVVVRTRNVRGKAEGAVDGLAGRFVELTVEDDGCGIDSKTLSQIFDPFFTTKPQGRGTGLGLSTVYGIVKQAGGHVWVDSEVGKGTIIRVWFPVANAEVEPLPDALFGPIRTVLLLNEDATRRAFTAEILEEDGYRVLIPESIGVACDLVETYGDRIHVLIIDETIESLRGMDVALGMTTLREDMNVVILAEDPRDEAEFADRGFRVIDRETRPERLIDLVRRLTDEAECSR